MKRAASATGRISICRPSVSSRRASGADLLEQLGVVRARLVEPEDRRRSRSRGRGRPRAAPSRGSARPWSGTCARCRRPRRRARAASSPAPSTTRTVPGAAISNVLSCEPYSSAFCAIRPTFGVVPIVAGSKAPCSLAVVDGLGVQRARSSSRGSRTWCPAARRPRSTSGRSRGSWPASTRR